MCNSCSIVRGDHFEQKGSITPEMQNAINFGEYPNLFYKFSPLLRVQTGLLTKIIRGGRKTNNPTPPNLTTTETTGGSMQSRGHKGWPLSAWADHIRASRQSYGAAAGFLITLQLRFHRNGLFKALHYALQLTSNLKHMRLPFSHSQFIASSVSLSACLSIASPSASGWNAGIVQRTWHHAKRESERERE